MLQWGNFMSVEPGLASLAFGAMVIVTILAAESFDPRLLWQGVNQEGINDVQ
jgi:paraquat-inducible protein A